MLSCVLKDVNGTVTAPMYPLSLKADTDEGVPADSLYATFLYRPTAELCFISVYDDGKMLFTGVVDEQEHEISGSGDFLKLSARSLAAYLIDNEAAPCTYDHPSAQLMYERYVKPYGITLSDEGDAVYFGEQNVLKGMSCWRVLKNFCAACYASVPRISARGTLDLRGIQNSSLTRFGGDGVPYISLSEVRKRCEEISAVYVKTANSGTYSLPIEDSGVVKRGIRRARYLNAALTESPISCADAMIRNGKAKAYALRLRCPSCLLGTEGNRAEVAGYEEEYYISAVHYRMTEDGEYTDVTLKRRMPDVAE